MRRVLTGPPRWAAAAGLVVLTAASWFAWAGWGFAEPGRFAGWQIAGTAGCLIAIALLAPRWLPGWLVGVVVPLSFTAAWAVTAASTDDQGLWPIGAFLVLLGTAAGALVLVPVGVRLRRVGAVPRSA